MPESKSKPEFKAAVGLSREWDARKAGREVARDTLEKLGTDPDFFLLFSTIHYEKWGGFKEFLAGVWDVLPEGTPLIGGTVAGFIIPQGCFTRGATALAVSYPNMDVAVGYGKNTKRAPHLAAKHCAEMIKRGLKDSKYKNKFLFEITSNGTLPKVPGIGRKHVFKSNFLGEILLTLVYLLNITLQYGAGREDEVFKFLSEYLPDYSMLATASYDDNRSLSNYQFYKNNVLTNSILAVGIATDIKPNIRSDTGLIPSGIKMSISDKKLFNCAFKKINGKKARDEILTLLGWTENFLDERLHRRTNNYPLCTMKDGVLRPFVIALFVGDSLCCKNSILENELEVYYASGKSMMESVENCLTLDNTTGLLFGLGVSCTSRMETLGYNVYAVRDRLHKYFENKPFLLLYGAGEGIKLQNSKAIYLNSSFNMAIFNH